jgi:hypothetical protein
MNLFRDVEFKPTVHQRIELERMRHHDMVVRVKEKAEAKVKLVESINSLTQLISGLKGKTIQETLEWHEVRLVRLKKTLAEFEES